MERGRLYIVSTPIGNLGDITARAIETLKSVDIIAAEDTRQTAKLKNAFNIGTPQISFHEHNAKKKAKSVVDMLLSGKNIAIVSDAGTPLISDPGSELIKSAVSPGIDVITIPGACALISALTLSAFDLSRFTFEGFIPREGADRKQILSEIAKREYTTVIYESPFRLKKTLADLRKNCGGDRPVCIARELTKVHEEALRGSIDSIIGDIGENEVKGEIVIVLAGINKVEKEIDDSILIDYAKDLMQNGLTKRDAVLKTALYFGVCKNRVYKLILPI